MKKAVPVALLLLTLTGCGSDFEWFPGADDSPNSFEFTVEDDNVDSGTVVESNTVTIAGIDASVTLPVSVTNGEFSINDGTWKTGSGTITVNQTLKVRHTASEEGGKTTETIVKVGNLTRTFKSTTNEDTTPDAFSFSSRQANAFGLYSSNLVTIKGINLPTAISLSGDGTFTVDGVEAASGSTVRKGQNVRIFHNVSTARTYKSQLTIESIFGKYSTTWKP